MSIMNEGHELVPDPIRQESVSTGEHIDDKVLPNPANFEFSLNGDWELASVYGDIVGFRCTSEPSFVEIS
jgi:hypothetical protein